VQTSETMGNSLGLNYKSTVDSERRTIWIVVRTSRRTL
jgi:hypothetical protein